MEIRLAMRNVILPAFEKYPAEAAIIGRLLAGYAEIEIGLMHCVQVVRDELDTALKVMFRARGETARIDIADALGRQHYDSLNLGTEFSMSVSDARWCMKVRNKFAHCTWHDDNSGKLAFVNLEELAKLNTPVKDLMGLTAYHVDVPILQDFEKYFILTDVYTIWVNHEGRLRAKKTKINPLPKPKRMQQPPLDLP